MLFRNVNIHSNQCLRVGRIQICGTNGCGVFTEMSLCRNLLKQDVVYLTHLIISDASRPSKFHDSANIIAPYTKFGHEGCKAQLN